MTDMEDFSKSMPVVSRAIAKALTTPDIEVRITFKNVMEGTVYKRAALSYLNNSLEIDHMKNLQNKLEDSSSSDIIELNNGSAIIFICE